MNSQVMALNGAGGGGGGVDEDYNQPPVITFAGPLNAAFPDGASVAAAVTDDGVPKPRAALAAAARLALRCSASRGWQFPSGGRSRFIQPEHKPGRQRQG